MSEKENSDMGPSAIDIGRAGAPKDTPAPKPSSAGGAGQENQHGQQAPPQNQETSAQEQRNNIPGAEGMDLDSEAMADAKRAQAMKELKNAYALFNSELAKQSAAKEKSQSSLKAPAKKRLAMMREEAKKAWLLRPGGNFLGNPWDFDGGEASDFTVDDLVMSGALPGDEISPSDANAMDLDADVSDRNVTGADDLRAEWERSGKKPCAVVLSTGEACGGAHPEALHEAAVKAQWRKAGGFQCTKTLSTGKTCYGYHPAELHDDAKAVAAEKKRAALSKFPELVESQEELDTERKEAKKAAREREMLRKMMAETLQLVSDKAEDKAKSKGDSKDSSKKDSSSGKRKAEGKANANNDDFTVVKSKKTKKDEKKEESKAQQPPKKSTCENCGKRHPGKCLACPTCKRMHSSEQCPPEGAKTGETGQKSIGSGAQQKPPPPQSNAPVRYSKRENFILVLMHRTNTAEGVATITRLINDLSLSSPAPDGAGTSKK